MGLAPIRLAEVRLWVMVATILGSADPGRDCVLSFLFFFSSRRRHTRFDCDWSSDVCSSDLALQFGESAALTLGVTYGLKYSIDEKRPNGRRHSFPSGHSSISFSSAEFMRKRYGWEYGIPAYAAASFVAYSRVEAREHHPPDVIAGASIGIVSSYIFTRRYKGWDIEPEVDGR